MRLFSAITDSVTNLSTFAQTAICTAQAKVNDILDCLQAMKRPAQAMPANNSKGVELFGQIAVEAKKYGVELIFLQAIGDKLIFRALTTNFYLASQFVCGQMVNYGNIAITVTVKI